MSRVESFPSAFPAPRAAVRVAWLALLLVTACGGGAPAAATGPNLLLVVFDTTRADHLGLYGGGEGVSPRVDALGARGLVLDSAWSASSLTPVSAGTFLTGVLPYRHGIRSLYTVGGNGLSPAVATLAERLSARGWNTAGFIGAPPMGSRYGLERGFGHWSEDWLRGVKRRKHQHLGNVYQRRADVTTGEALRWLETEGLEQDGPFALLLHYFDAHDASIVPPRAFLAPRVSFPLPRDLDQRGHLADIKDPEQRIELYNAELRYMDDQLGRVLTLLERRGVLDNTLVVFLADHGEGLGQHDFWTHGLLWSEQLRVPLVLAGPGVPVGARLTDRVRLVDLVPTLGELLDLPLGGEQLDGTSFLPLLEGPEAEPREHYAEVHHAAEDRLERDTELYSLTLGRWKFVHRPAGGEPELYDLEADPGELVNLYTPDQPVAAALRRSIEARGAPDASASSTAGLDAAELEMLKELGYL